MEYACTVNYVLSVYDRDFNPIKENYYSGRYSYYDANYIRFQCTDWQLTFYALRPGKYYCMSPGQGRYGINIIEPLDLFPYLLKTIDGSTFAGSNASAIIVIN